MEAQDISSFLFKLYSYSTIKDLLWLLCPCVLENGIIHLQGNQEHQACDSCSDVIENTNGRGPFRTKMNSEGGHTFRNGGGYIPNPRSRLEDGKRVVATSETRDGRPRFNPYYRGGRRRDDNPGRDHVSPHSGPRRADSSHPERPESSDGIKSWFKVTIPHDKKYEKSWLLGVLQNVSKVPFTAVSYHCAHNRAHFFIDDLETAQALKRVSRTFTDRDNFKVTVLIRSSAAPYLNQSKGIKAEDMAHIKSCMQKRYQGATQSLDMKALRADPDLNINKVDFIMNRRCYMQVMLQMIEENVPELLGLDISYNKLYKLDNMEELYLRAPKLKSLNVSHNMLKSVWELDKIKQLKLDELWLDGNPLCDLFQDKTTYIRAMRERFPNLLRLDGQELPPPITFDVETPTSLPPCKGSYLGTDDIKGLVLRFLQEYYACYDSEDRQGLLNAYYDEACCTLSIPCIQGQNTSRSSLGEYIKDSLNIKRLKDPTLRFKLTKRKRLNVVRFLNELPKTQHDLNSFVVDVTTHTPPKKEKRETKAKSAKTKQRSKLVDEVATEEMSKEQLEEDIVRLQEDIERLREELDQERKERNSFQMEQEKTRSFWEITRRQLYEKNSELRYKEREMKEAEELHQVEIKMLKQKLKHLVYDHQNKVAELKAQGCVAMKLAQKEHHRTQESTLCSDIRRLQVESKEKELANERVRKSLKKKHDEEIGHIRNDFERQVTEMKVKYDKKMQVLRDELELCRKREIQELEERNNGHIVTLTENHEKAFSDIKEYYNDISINNLILKQQIEDMRKREERLEKEMADVQLQNRRLVEPLQKSTRLRLKSTEKELNALKWQHEVLEQRLETIQSERDELDRKFTAAINEVQQKSGFKNVIVERKLLALGESLEKKEAQLSEVLAASNLDPTALSTITRKLEDVLGAKNNTIEDLQYELAKVRKAHNELLRTYQAKMHPVAIPVDEPGLKPGRAYPDKALFRAGPVAAPT